MNSAAQIIAAEVKAARRFNHAAVMLRKMRFYEWADTAKSMRDLAIIGARTIRRNQS